MKYEIEIPMLPEGYKAVAYRYPKEGESYFFDDKVFVADFDFTNVSRIIVEKIKPRRRVFECISETPRLAIVGDWAEVGNDLIRCRSNNHDCETPIWKEVTEND